MLTKATFLGNIDILWNYASNRRVKCISSYSEQWNLSNLSHKHINIFKCAYISEYYNNNKTIIKFYPNENYFTQVLLA